MNEFDVIYRRILCPIDFSHTSRRAFYQAVALSRLYEAELAVLHIQDTGWQRRGYWAAKEELEAVKQVERLLERRLDELIEHDLLSDEDKGRISMELSAGKPWIEIVRFAEENACDLIVMGTQGEGKVLNQPIMGSTAERVIRSSSCNVLIVKPDDWQPDFKKLVRD